MVPGALDLSGTAKSASSRIARAAVTTGSHEHSSPLLWIRYGKRPVDLTDRIRSGIASFGFQSGADGEERVGIIWPIRRIRASARE